jgi:hypothetical protein
MSYCRFSTDNFNSDVYVYESEQGYVVHIAENRYVFDRSLLPKVTLRSTQEEYYEYNKFYCEFQIEPSSTCLRIFITPSISVSCHG